MHIYCTYEELGVVQGLNVVTSNFCHSRKGSYIVYVYSSRACIKSKKVCTTVRTVLYCVSNVVVKRENESFVVQYACD
jgi:hypothetical protein